MVERDRLAERFHGMLDPPKAPRSEKKKPFCRKDGTAKVWTHGGLRCKVVRSLYLGHYCGYVEIPRVLRDADFESFDSEFDFDVHGGVTFNDGRWVGFDCAHAGDFVPGLLVSEREDDERKRLMVLLSDDDIRALQRRAPRGRRDDTFRDLRYAVRETCRLADQLKEHVDAYASGRHRLGKNAPNPALKKAVERAYKDSFHPTKKRKRNSKSNSRKRGGMSKRSRDIIAGFQAAAFMLAGMYLRGR